jgi:hypothetical protein
MPAFDHPGQRVHFTYPGGRKKHGTIVDATSVKKVEGSEGVYAIRIELIQFDGEEKKHIRFAYWVKRKNSDNWVWANRPWVFNSGVTSEAIKEAESKGFFSK